MNKITIEMVGILGAVAMLSAALVVVLSTIQEANAQGSTSFSFSWHDVVCIVFSTCTQISR